MRRDFIIKTVRDLVNYAMSNNFLRKVCLEPGLNGNTVGVFLAKGGQMGFHDVAFVLFFIMTNYSSFHIGFK